MLNRFCESLIKEFDLENELPIRNYNTKGTLMHEGMKATMKFQNYFITEGSGILSGRFKVRFALFINSCLAAENAFESKINNFMFVTFENLFLGVILA